MAIRRKFGDEQYFMVQMTIGKPIGVGSGKISARDFSEEEAKRLADNIDQNFLVVVSDNAAGYCIDGRMCKETLAMTKPEIGPSVAGGSTITAYAAAELVGDYFSETSGPTSLARVKEIDDILTDGGITLGAHVSRGALEATQRTFVDATGQSKTGCGANDEFKAILDCVFTNVEAVNGTTKSLLGNHFDSASMQFIDGGALKSRIASYSSHDVLQAVAATSRGKNVEVLEGDHGETLVVFNYVNGTTVNRDALVADTGKQVFVVDMWYVDKLAHALAQGRPDAPEMFTRLKHAMVAFQVATYLVLCDGTHRPVMLKQAQDVPVLAV